MGDLKTNEVCIIDAGLCPSLVDNRNAGLMFSKRFINSIVERTL